MLQLLCPSTIRNYTLPSDKDDVEGSERCSSVDTATEGRISSPSLSWLCNEVGIGILLIHDMVSLILVFYHSTVKVIDSFSPSHQPFKDINFFLETFFYTQITQQLLCIRMTCKSL